MKAAIIEKPGVLTVRDVPMPVFGEYEALCQLLYGATCTGTDQHLIAGRFPWPVTYPTILGHESIGRVVEVGRKVRNLRVGDLVTRVGAPASPKGEFAVNWGGFAEFGVAGDWRAMQEDGLPPKQFNPYRINQTLPADFDPAASTMMITWRETLSYLTRMGVGAGARVLVVGSGGNGLSFVSHVANLGAARVALIGSGDRAATGRAAGATDYFDYKEADLDKHVAEAVPEKFDFIIDAVGKAGVLDHALRFLKPGGVVGIYGIDDYGQCTLNPVLAKVTFTYSHKGYDEAETHDRVVEFVKREKLDAGVWLDLARPFALADIGSAFDAVAARKFVKALVRLTA